MHMAYDIKNSHFTVAVDGAPSTRDALLDWDVRDRLGIVVDRPFGALDASLMIMLAATAFYDAVPKRRQRPLYPDMYLIHAGGPWGAHMAFDFAPDRKEVHCSPGPADLLRAINQVGVTHLLIPDREPRAVQHRYKEPEAALDRLKQVYVYGPTVTAPDVRLSAPSFAPLKGTLDSTLRPEPHLTMLEEMGRAPELRATDQAELAIILPMLRDRLTEIPTDDPEYLRQLNRLDTATAAGTLAEDYRRLDPKAALDMLHTA